MTAKVLDRQRLGKQRVEALQILQTLKRGKYTCCSPVCKSQPIPEPTDGRLCPTCMRAIVRITPWYNHPAVQMWKGYENGLILYLSEMCREWVSRGYQDTCLEKAQALAPASKVTLLPDWIGNETFHRSHQSNLLRKNSDHYRQYFLGVPDDLPYVWPSKETL